MSLKIISHLKFAANTHNTEYINLNTYTLNREQESTKTNDEAQVSDVK
jgi:hypothetical protein